LPWRGDKPEMSSSVHRKYLVKIVFFLCMVKRAYMEESFISILILLVVGINSFPLYMLVGFLLRGPRRPPTLSFIDESEQYFSSCRARKSVRLFCTPSQLRKKRSPLPPAADTLRCRRQNSLSGTHPTPIPRLPQRFLGAQPRLEPPPRTEALIQPFFRDDTFRRSFSPHFEINPLSSSFLHRHNLEDRAITSLPVAFSPLFCLRLGFFSTTR